MTCSVKSAAGRPTDLSLLCVDGRLAEFDQDEWRKWQAVLPFHRIHLPNDVLGAKPLEG